MDLLFTLGTIKCTINKINRLLMLNFGSLRLLLDSTQKMNLLGS